VAKVRVVLEVAPKRSFASALDWPGWSRAGKTPDESLEALLAYAPRYAVVARRAKVAFRPPAAVQGLDVIQRRKGGSGTEFGVPSESATVEAGPVSNAELKRLVALLHAAWATFDAAAKKSKGVQLRLGPRGGGRQVPKMVEHVREAESAYVHQLGSRPPRGAAGTMAALRIAFVEALTARAAGTDVPNANKVKKVWSPRYAVRRSAWHAVDHAWEIEDRSTG
jgi:hypothetical protein